MGRILLALVGALIAAFAGVFVYYGGEWRGIFSTATSATWPDNDGSDFPAARRQFKTALSFPTDDAGPVAPPPPKIFSVVNYRSAVGSLPAYLTPDPKDGKKHPAIIWITGGDCNSIGEMWLPADPKNDQTAAAFREAGLVMMAPSLRGGNTNPGREEGFAGEIDDIVAAADFLARQPYVDSARIYLGGHSTGATLVLLTAEASDRFRAVFAFGPRDAATDHRLFDGTDLRKLDPRELLLRTGAYWLASVHKPLFVIEGTGTGFIDALKRMRQKSKNPNIVFQAVEGADHFSILAPVTKIVAHKILQDAGPTSAIRLSEAELTAPFRTR
jgi:alpha/beta superfamily hydrolase